MYQALFCVLITIKIHLEKSHKINYSEEKITLFPQFTILIAGLPIGKRTLK